MDVERHQPPVLQTLWYIRLLNHTLGTFQMIANHKYSFLSFGVWVKILSVMQKKKELDARVPCYYIYG